jgi:hypothetical protein
MAQIDPIVNQLLRSYLVGVALSCFGSLVGFNGAIDTMNLVLFQLLRNT